MALKKLGCLLKEDSIVAIGLVQNQYIKHAAAFEISRWWTICRMRSACVFKPNHHSYHYQTKV